MASNVPNVRTDDGASGRSAGIGVGWQADILMVTDGEIPMPSKTIRDQLETAKEELGLEVHGLMVGRSDTTPAMEAFCSHLHVFQSWGVLNTSRNAYAW